MAKVLGIAPIVGATPEFMRQQQALVMRLLGITPDEVKDRQIYMQLFVVVQHEIIHRKERNILGWYHHPFPSTKKIKHLAWRFALGEKNVFCSPRLVAVAKLPESDPYCDAGILCLRWYRRNAPKHLG